MARKVWTQGELLERGIQIVKDDKELLPENREIILEYTRKSVAEGRCVRRIRKLHWYIRQLSKWLGKPFPEATRRDIELERDRRPGPFPRKDGL